MVYPRGGLRASVRGAGKRRGRFCHHEEAVLRERGGEESHGQGLGPERQRGGEAKVRKTRLCRAI